MKNNLTIFSLLLIVSSSSYASQQQVKNEDNSSRCLINRFPQWCDLLPSCNLREKCWKMRCEKLLKQKEQLLKENAASKKATVTPPDQPLSAANQDANRDGDRGMVMGRYLGYARDFETPAERKAKKVIESN